MNGDFLGKSAYSMANGSIQFSERVIIHSVEVGQRVVNNVTASVTPAESEPLHSPCEARTKLRDYQVL